MRVRALSAEGLLIVRLIPASVDDVSEKHCDCFILIHLHPESNWFKATDIAYQSSTNQPMILNCRNSP